jgi:hypothetical protein
VSTQLETRSQTRVDIGAPRSSRDIALIDLIDRLLAGGVVLTGDITLAVADIDLVQVALRALISSVSTLEEGSSIPSPEEGPAS